MPVYALISERWCFWLNGSFTFRRDQGISLESISIFSNAKVVRHSCRSQEVCALSTHHGFLNLSLFSLHCTVVWTLAVLNKWLSIYENHVCELWLKKWIWRWSSQLGTLLTVRSNENKAWKKFSLVGDFHPWPLQYRCSALPTEPTSQLGANIGSE